VAVKVTEVPAQMLLPGLAFIDTEGTKTGFTVVADDAALTPEHPFASV